MPNRRHALIIASHDYQADSRLRRLVAPPQDADALGDVLHNPAIGGFEVRKLLNRPSYETIEAIEEFYTAQSAENVALLYFSGHGIKNIDGQLYFAMPNTRLDRLHSTAIKAQVVSEIINTSRAKQRVVILDCCYSGAFPRGMTIKADSKKVNIGDYFEARGYVVLTASDAIQYAFEEEVVKGQGQASVFTRTLVTGLSSGEADLDGDGYITIDELYNYLFAHMSLDRIDQTPRKWALDVQGQIVVAENPHVSLKSEFMRTGTTTDTERRLRAAQVLGNMTFMVTAFLHEFRNHIGAVKLNLQILENIDQLSEERRREILRSLVPSVLKRLQQVNSILDNLHQPSQIMTDTAVNVNHCLDRAVARLSAKNWVEMSLAEDLPSVKTSPEVLTEAFKVFINNSIEAIRERGKDYSLVITSQLKDNSTISVIIKDNGMGIRPDDLSKVFELGFTTKKNGAGFGLFWAKAYFDGLGGNLSIASLWQKGTVVEISLPAAQSAMDDKS
jgi:signal transduction histidine kinase